MELVVKIFVKTKSTIKTTFAPVQKRRPNKQTNKQTNKGASAEVLLLF
jgi:hypothetical protein